MANCFYSSVMFPFFTINGLPEYPTHSFFLLWLSELLHFIDIILKFFKQGVDEQGYALFDPLIDCAYNYLHSEFLINLICIIPWGYVL